MGIKFRKQALVFTMMLLILAASALFLVWSYVLKYPFAIPHNTVLYENPVKTYEDGRMLVITGANDLNARIFNYIEQNVVLPESIGVQGAACVFGSAETEPNELYINIENKKLFGTVFSFNCQWELSLDKTGANVRFYDIRLGRFKLPYIGQFFWRLLSLPDNVPFRAADSGELMYLSAIETEKDGDIILTYDYDTEKLAEALTKILSLSDDKKIEFHSGNGTADESLIKIASEKTVSASDAASLVKQFEKSPETFLSLCMLLSGEGIREFYAKFGEAYYKHVSPDALIKASEDELDSGLDEFNKKFARQLLQYLFRNPDYYIEDGSIYIKGEKVTPDTVLTETEGENYDVEIIADEQSIKAVYKISDKRYERVILAE